MFTFLVTDLILFDWKTTPEVVRKHTWIQFCTFMILTFLKAAFTVMNRRKSRSFDRASLYVCLYFCSLLSFTSLQLSWKCFKSQIFSSYGYVRWPCVCGRRSETRSKVLKQTYLGELAVKEERMQAKGGCCGHSRKLYLAAVDTLRVTEYTGRIFVFKLKSYIEWKPFYIAAG